MMDTGLLLSLLSILVTLALGVLVFVNNRRAARTAEKKLTVEEQQASDGREDVIAKRRREELDRLYVRTDDMEADIQELKRDRKILGDTVDAQAETISDLQLHARESDNREIMLYHHVKDLRTHIVAQLPPPPPLMPADLVDWFEEFERTDPPLIGGA